MSEVFLRLQLDARDSRPGDVVLINVAHIRRVHPMWPSGCRVVMDDTTLHVRASFRELTLHLVATGGNVIVKHVDSGEHQVDETYEAARADVLP